MGGGGARRIGDLAALLASGAALAAPVPAGAQGTLTPEGPATLQGTWLGAVPAVYIPPGILVGWSVSVGPGGNAGPVRVRVLPPGPGKSGPTEWLPGTPGTYRFALKPGLPDAHYYHGPALDQHVGGHAIVRTHPPRPELGRWADPAQLHALDVFRPPLADDARGVEYSERRMGEELLVRGTIERDIDRDRLGDETQDLGDLRLLKAGLSERGGGWLQLRARVRNVGDTVRHRPGIRLSLNTWQSRCQRSRKEPHPAPCRGAPLAPGATAGLALLVRSDRGHLPARVSVAAEGPDTDPADNKLALPRLRARAISRGRLSVSLASTRPGRARIVARVAGVRLARAVRFTGRGRRAVVLAPARWQDRGRLAAALRRPGRLAAVVTARMGRVRISLRAKL